MLKTVFDVLLTSVSPWQARVDDETAERFDSIVLHPNIDFLEKSQANPLLSVALLIIDEKQRCSLEPDQLSRISGVDPAFFSESASWDDLPESVRFEALGRLTDRVLRTWRNQVRDRVLIPSVGTCDAFEIVAE